MQYVKKITIFIVFITGFLPFIGCTKTVKKQISIESNEEQRLAERFLNDLKFKILKEKIILLSYKYNIPESVIANIIDEYYSKHDCTYNLHKELNLDGNLQNSKFDLKINMNIKNTLDRLSTKYNIPKDKLSSIIIDFKIMSQ